jgi:hypothetical protein
MVVIKTVIVYEVSSRVRIRPRPNYGTLTCTDWLKENKLGRIKGRRSRDSWYRRQGSRLHKSVRSIHIFWLTKTIFLIISL